MSGEDPVDCLRRFVLQESAAKVLVLIGPTGIGKSTTLTRLRNTISPSERRAVRFLNMNRSGDLEWLMSREDVSLRGDTNVLIVDHCEALFTRGYIQNGRLLARYIVNICRCDCRLVLLIDDQGYNQFHIDFGIPIDVAIGADLTPHSIVLERFAPIGPEDIDRVCSLHGVPRAFFDTDAMRTPSIINLVTALACANRQSETTKLSLVELERVVFKWLLLSDDVDRDHLLTRVSDFVGRRTLGYPEAFVTLSDITRGLDITSSAKKLSHRIHTPLYREGVRILFRPSEHERMGAAMALISMIQKGHYDVFIPIPPHIDVMRVLPNVAEAEGISAEECARYLSRRRAEQFHQIGFVGVIVANLLIAISDRSDPVDFSHLWLQGPEHDTSVRIPRDVQAQVRSDCLSRLLSEADTLVFLTRDLYSKGTRSCYEGERSFWVGIREWSRSLGMRSTIDATLASFVSRVGAWHYEDVLDIAVTDAVTEFLKTIETRLSPVIVAPDMRQRQFLSDMWDGLNDGLWDSVISQANRIDALVFGETAACNISLQGSHIQRASFDRVDLTRYNLAACSMTLADLRSASNVSTASLEGADWWSAMLCPADRYELSRRYADDPRYRVWCKNPPWVNPYHVSEWPFPLGDV